MNIIEFNGDPMLQLEKFDNMEDYKFYLNEEAMDEIRSYSNEVNENIPEFFADKHSDYIYLAEGGIDEEGNEFPDTYIAINEVNNVDYPYIISSIYASDFQYETKDNGKDVYLKKNNRIKK